jgi:uncharacterized RDD family membrane protein YckC
MECPHCYKQVKAHSKGCPACGGYIPPGQHLLEEAGLAKPDAPAAKSQTVPARSTTSQPLAKLSDRFNAFVLDTAVLFGVFTAADAWIFMRWGSIENLELRLTIASLGLALTANTLILFSYGCLLEAACGATLGKIIVGLRVVRTGGRSAFLAAAIRNLFRVLDGLGFYLVGAVVAACSPWRQRLGDLSAGTAVMEEQFRVTSRVLALVVWIGVVAGAFWAVPRICAEQNAAHSTPYLDQVVVQVGRTDNAAYFRVAGLTFDVQVNRRPSSATR